MASDEGKGDVRPRILIVDDSASARSRVRRHLEAPPIGAIVDEAADGPSGLRATFDSAFDCVLCDVEMPGLDGFGLLRMVRATRSRFDLPIVLVTARQSVTEKVAAFRLGASDYVAKPFEPDELVARIETQVALRRMHDKLARAAELDGLTEVWNRRKVMAALDAEMARCHRLQRSVGILLIDVDEFKRINDRYGHPTGDAVLVDLARLMSNDRRAYDVVGRMGGEEFAVVLPDSGLSQARTVAERMRTLIATSSLGGLPVGEVTISIGIAYAPLDPTDTSESLYRRADARLYEAKRLGRNRVAGGEPRASRSSASGTRPAVSLPPRSDSARAGPLP